MIVDLSRPTHVIIVELFKHICGISLVSAEWYEGPPIPVAMEGGKVRGGQYRRFGIGSLADDLVKARAKAKKEVVQSPTSENKMDMS